MLSQGIHMCNMKALSLLVWKLWPRLKFFKRRSNFKVKITRSKNYGTNVKGLVRRNTHMKYESSIFLICFESYGQGKFLSTQPMPTWTVGRHVNSTAFGGSLPLFECIFRLPICDPDLPLFVRSPSFQSFGVVHTFRLRLGHYLPPL